MKSQTASLHRRFSSVLIAGVSLLAMIFASLYVVTLVQLEDGMEKISLNHWLDVEVQRYSLDWAELGKQTSEPNPFEFDFFGPDRAPPGWLGSYTDSGFHEHELGDEDKHFVVAEHPSGKGLMYLVFKDNADDYLDGYERKLHTTAVVLALLGIAAMLLASLVLARRLSRPLRAVADKIRDLSPDGSTIQVDAPYTELRAIEKALADAQQLVAASLRREREFSRFASHEIRTPLTVIKGSSEYLARAWPQADAKGRAVARIEKASDDMAILIETFLLLGRSELIDEQMADVNLASLVAELVQVAEHARRQRHATENHSLSIDIDAAVTIKAPTIFLHVLMHNLITNALDHAAGPIFLQADQNNISISNPVSNESRSSSGYGYGLIISERICERMQWQLELSNDASSFMVEIGMAAE
ncbi:sensor histidine kinase [Granulosicoccus antarcticus]|uniref:histidine kinase n=1 Tax=Granulosicoccus antarcticus IMCC3135 TaxID=1192854 RepID=A0A2Z2P0B7_9GAMM|nr:HAMP domain-containing sensor histidine kinase [Granulosicoccus antarcticus]ASJ73607.1 Signal transduction histidine-protein kinase ArlS [Granulosicoccus antarcticus IMCC3135]